MWKAREIDPVGAAVQGSQGCRRCAGRGGALAAGRAPRGSLLLCYPVQVHSQPWIWDDGVSYLRVSALSPSYPSCLDSRPFLATSCCRKVVFPPISSFTDFICETRRALALSHRGPSPPAVMWWDVLWIKCSGASVLSRHQTCDAGNRWSMAGGTARQTFCQVYVP